ncbi:hypothetical protein EDB81DRAFT_76200 [Dactylonectria macrodidyma]|uniref:Uncharacterized protein n=1 Tax=Dactylonectria macrodidyma TaxID=307937 RepID=A0A9P9DI25_9HYPO|nr:hypothetical protein EDB81DRAFT_237089 [Dactylonectria macrodidyma]KAH7137890.1 hypothetical protein EDB81DRAFT_76200 [Dactylonectria macrodidyma]
MARSSISGQGSGQPSLNPLGVQFFSSLEGLEMATYGDRQLIRGHNLVGAVRLQFARPAFFDEEAGEHREVLNSLDGIDVPLSMHVFPFPQMDEWEGQWFFFDVQLHPYQLHFRRKIVDGEESAVGTWEDLYGKLAQVRGYLCIQPIATRSLRLVEVESCFPSIAPRTSFHGPIDTTTFRFKAETLTNHQRKCCGFVQCRTYLTPPRDGDTPFKGGQTFHILAYMPHDQQPWRSRIEWMKNSAEGGFTSRKWIYGRGSIVGVLNATLLEDELQPGQDILVVLVDEFGFTSKASFDAGGSSGIGVSPRKAGATEHGKGRNPFTNSPVGSPAKRSTEPPSLVGTSRDGKGSGKEMAVENESSETATQLPSPPKLGSPNRAGTRAERQQGLNGSEEMEAAQERNGLKHGVASSTDAMPRKRAKARK